ncbi:MAG: thioredoxin fold domain-containing protein [Gammaproteobacteria bacterium]|nr:thioredoxin fold domain-containing protein [Gammaproteobacteria bacterium]MBL6998365.1 thioredoxin fold domain-containing protein [Gammaproteobacteria bacterium]
MHWFSSRKFLLLLMIVTFKSTLAAPPDGYNFLPLSDAMQQAASAKKPVLLYFGRYGCSTCLKMHNEVFSDAALHKKLAQNFVLAYVDTESGNRIRLDNGERTTEMQFAARNKILGTPTFIYFSDEQQPVMRRAGFQSIQQMSDYSDFVSLGHFKTTDLKRYLAEK